MKPRYEPSPVQEDCDEVEEASEDESHAQREQAAPPWQKHYPEAIGAGEKHGGPEICKFAIADQRMRRDKANEAEEAEKARLEKKQRFLQDMATSKYAIMHLEARAIKLKQDIAKDKQQGVEAF